MRIVDAHTHVHSLPGSPWDSPPERLLPLMDAAGIARSIIMPYSEITPANAHLLDEAEAAVRGAPERLVAFARMHPDGGDAGLALFADAVQRRGFRGLKLHPVGSMVHPADDRHIAFVRLAHELGVPVLFHCGDEEFTLPFQIARLLDKVPEASIILGHMGGYFHARDAIRVAKSFPNCYLETSACPDPRLVAEAIDALGPERVIFGSDGPGCLPALEVQKIRMLKLGAESEGMIFHGTIEGLIGDTGAGQEAP